MRRVVVTGLGAITPLAVGTRTTWRRLVDSCSGLNSVATLEPQRQWRQLPSLVAGIVPSGRKDDGGWQSSDWINASDQRRMATFTQYAVAAAEMALEDAGWKPETQDEKEMMGVCLGSGIGDFHGVYDTILDYDKEGYRKVSPLFVPRLLINLAAGHISMKYGLQGPNHAVTTACTTGAHSIGDASRFIACGDANVMIAGGSESCIHPLALAGFARARSLATNYNHAPTEASRPFDRDRCGFVIAEGAGVFVLEELEHAKARGANIYAEIKGYGCSGDANHMTAPRKDGHGAFLAMKRALKGAGIAPKDVDYINAHGTSTPLGDAAENYAIKKLMLGEEGKQRPSEVTVSSTKGSIGHLLGAAGAIEALFTVLSIKEDVVPPTLNLHNLENGFDLNYVPLTSQVKRVNVALTNSFGFGGTNASLVFSKY